ncbi:MAG: RimK family alpha-L-glutamate ligase [Pirellulales bacterium]
MRIAILGEPGGWHVGRLVAAFANRGHDPAVIRWNELSAGIGLGAAHGPRSLAEADAVAVRGRPGIPDAGDRLEEVIFRMDSLARLEAGGMPVVNPPRALELAIDKYLSLAILAASGIPVPRTLVVQDAAAARDALEMLGGDCVAKPLFGSRGAGLARVTSGEEAAALVRPGGGVVYLQEFLPHAGWDVRLLVIDDRVFAMKRIAAPGEWRTNISRGARPEAFAPPPAWIDLAIRATRAMGALVAGVDVLQARNGSVSVLEVNGVPAWRGLQNVVPHDIAGEIAVAIERAARFGSAARPA